MLRVCHPPCGQEANCIWDGSISLIKLLGGLPGFLKQSCLIIIHLLFEGSHAASELNQVTSRTRGTCARAKSLQSCPLRPHGLQPASLLCPWGFSRQKYWSGLPCPPPGHLPYPGIEPMSPAASELQVDSLPLSHQGSPDKLTVLINSSGESLSSSYKNQGFLSTYYVIGSLPDSHKCYFNITISATLLLLFQYCYTDEETKSQKLNNLLQVTNSSC